MEARGHARYRLHGAVIFLAWLTAKPAFVGQAAGAAAHEQAADLEVALDAPPASHTVTGVLAMLDLSMGKGMLKTDLDKPIFFRVGNPEQFARLSIGDRVTMQLDEDGRVVKVIEAVPSELPVPVPPPP
ncbi:MAG TPA: hypothetical protein VFS39_12560 [Nitrospira sp.]|nr:hypothetical protein [Nitrospira sp.]